MKAQAHLTQARLRALLEYDQTEGVFRWLVYYGGLTVGSAAGTMNTNGYMVIGIGGQKYRTHRLAWLYTHGVWPTDTIDHMDCDRTNNRISNLRAVPHCINMQNMRQATKANALGELGVYWSNKRKGYMASVSLNNKKKRRGPYKTQARASLAYIDMKRSLHVGCTL